MCSILVSYYTGLIPRTYGPFNVYSAQRLDLFAWCVRLCRLLVGFRTHFKSLHFLSFFLSIVDFLSVVIKLVSLALTAAN